jgi:type VI secretion system protein ImpH
MAHPDRSATFALILRLMERPHAFDFFQAVRRIEAVMGNGAPMLGATTRPRQDPVRFMQSPTLAFEPSAIKGYEPATDHHPGRIDVAFMGLTGANGPLPLHITEYARDRVRDARDDTLHRFFDVFNHRAVSLFYRAWAVNRPATLRDRAAREGERGDRWGFYVACLSGLGLDALRERDALPDHAKWHYAGRLGSQARPPESIEAIVAEDFSVPCEVVEFVGQWLDLPVDAQLSLGGNPDNARLGSSAIVGKRYWDCQQKFRVRLGPMRRADYEAFLPGSPGFDRLAAWVRQHIGFELLWEAQLILDKEDATGTRLAGSPDTPGAARLGWTSWIMSDPLPENPDQLILRGPEAPRTT